MLYKFPLKENSKIPTVKNWSVHDYTRSVEESNCNYGVVCGYKSGIIVIDYDCYKENISLKINIDELKRIHGQYSYIVSTPSGGFHVYHKIEEKHRDWKNITGIEGFIDIRTTGGYVVGANSSIYGRKYTVINGDIDFITDMPDTMFNLLNNNFKPRKVYQNIYDDDFDDIEIDLCNLGFTNIKPISEYNFKCDQMGTNSKCPLCEHTHTSNHFFYFKNDIGTFFVKNHSNKCIMTKLKTTYAFTDEETVLIEEEGFPECYIPMKNRFENEEKVAMIKDHLIYVVNDKLYLSQKQLKERYQDWLLDDKLFITMWLRDRTKRFYKTMDFLPNQIVEGTYNLWKGYEIENIPSECEKGDITPFLRIVNALTDNNSDYMFKWLAQLFQKPETKPKTSLIIRSEQGTGKNSIYEIIARIMGNDLYFETGNADQDIFGRFSTAFENRKLVLIDEADIAFSHNAKLKALVTNETTQIERKGVQPITIKNLAGVCFITNENVPVKIEMSDRRFVVYDSNNDLQSDTAFWNNFHKVWKFDKTNLRAVYDYLMNIDISKTDWKMDRPKTQAYIDIRQSCLPLQIKWISRLIEEFPQTWINKPIPNRELFENYEHFLPSGTSNMKSFGKLIEHMVKKYNLVGVTKIKTRIGIQWDIDRHIVYGWLTKNGFSDITELDPPIVNHYY
jgi:hypothetical protein